MKNWAVLTYSGNRVVINEKKSADKGIDGIAYTRKSKDEVLPVVISVKSGKIGRKEMGELRGTIQRETAAAGIMNLRRSPKSAENSNQGVREQQKLVKQKKTAKKTKIIFLSNEKGTFE